MDERPLLNPAAGASSSARTPELLGTFGTLLQVFRLYCGTGLLAFPYAVKCGGLVAAPVALLVIGWCNNYTLKMLVCAKRKVRRRLESLSFTLSSFLPSCLSSSLSLSLSLVFSLFFLVFIPLFLRSFPPPSERYDDI